METSNNPPWSHWREHGTESWSRKAPNPRNKDQPHSDVKRLYCVTQDAARDHDGRRRHRDRKSRRIDYAESGIFKVVKLLNIHLNL